MTFTEAERLHGELVRNRKSGKLYRIIVTNRAGETWGEGSMCSGTYSANQVIAVQIRDGRQYGAVRYIKPESYDVASEEPAK